jgi:dolichol-phosphate mannosyltransferase
MDCDLQDRPEEIPKLYKKIQSGYDVVFAKREKRKDPIIKKILSKLFYLIYNYFTDSSFDSSVANFSISKKVVVDNFKLIREQSRSFPLVVNWIGFKVGYQKVSHSKRFAGKSSYTLSKLVNLATDSIISQSNKPLRISVKFGFLLSFVAVIVAIILFIMRLSTEIRIEGWTSIVVSIFFLSGLILANIGVVGIYLGKVFDEAKKRPLYIIKDTIGIKNRKIT